MFMLHLPCTHHGIYEYIQVTKVWKQPTDSYIPWCKDDRQLLGASVIYQVGCWPTHESMNKAIEIFNIYFWRPAGPDCRSSTGTGKTETSLLTGADEGSCTLRQSWDEGQNNRLLGSWMVRPACWSWRISGGWGVGCGSLWGHRSWGQNYQRALICMRSPSWPDTGSTQNMSLQQWGP